MKRLSAFTSNLADLFTTPINTWQHLSLIGFTVLFFIRIIQFPISDWLLNTAGLWEDGLRIYELDPNRVYPPWGLILLLPYYLMNATGSRIASVLVVAWLS